MEKEEINFSKVSKEEKKNNNQRRKSISSKSKRKSESSEQKKTPRRPLPKPHETEEKAMIRRFHDAQRMARFRARRKKALEDTKALEAARLAEIALISELRKINILLPCTNSDNSNSVPEGSLTSCKIEDDAMHVTMFPLPGENKYSHLLNVIKEIGKNVRLAYAGSRTSAERLKTGIAKARLLIKDCLLETEVNTRQ